jgi:DNA-directed RNA polymerase specialized sigma24 family protein
MCRSAGQRQVTAPVCSTRFAAVDPARPEPTTDLLALDQALEKLAGFDERKSRIVEIRFFGGLSEEETAEVMQISLRIVQREWNLARAWLSGN